MGNPAQGEEVVVGIRCLSSSARVAACTSFVDTGHPAHSSVAPIPAQCHLTDRCSGKVDRWVGQDAGCTSLRAFDEVVDRPLDCFLPPRRKEH